MLIVGNKCDLVEKREVETNSAEQFACQNNIKHLECSALRNINIQNAFYALIKDIMNEKKKGKFFLML